MEEKFLKMAGITCRDHVFKDLESGVCVMATQISKEEMASIDVIKKCSISVSGANQTKGTGQMAVPPKQLSNLHSLETIAEEHWMVPPLWTEGPRGPQAAGCAIREALPVSGSILEDL